jgi:hypothetical protein
MKNSEDGSDIAETEIAAMLRFEPARIGETACLQLGIGSLPSSRFPSLGDNVVLLQRHWLNVRPGYEPTQ